MDRLAELRRCKEILDAISGVGSYHPGMQLKDVLDTLVDIELERAGSPRARTDDDDLWDECDVTTDVPPKGGWSETVLHHRPTGIRISGYNRGSALTGLNMRLDEG